MRNLTIIGAIAVFCVVTPSLCEAGEWNINGPDDGVVFQIVPHLSQPDVFYARTRLGIARSADGGQTWRQTGQSISAYQLVVDEDDDALVIFNWSHEHIISNSFDHGATWTEVKNGVNGIAHFVDEEGPGIVAWNGSSIDVSVNGGTHWQHRTDDVDPLVEGDIRIIVSPPASPGTMYVSYGNLDAGYAIYRSDNGGRSFTTPETRFNGRVFIMTCGATADDPVIASVLWGGLFRSLDRGLSWTQIPSPEHDTHISLLEISPHRPLEVWAYVSEEGLYRSDDTGQTWQSVDSVRVSGKVESVVFDANQHDVIIVGGTLIPNGIHRSEDQGSSWQAFAKGLPPVMVQSLTVDPTTPGTIYAAAELYYSLNNLSHGGIYRSRDYGQDWQMLEGSENITGDIAIDPEDNQHLYAGSSSGLLQSFDGGLTWLPDQSALAGQRIGDVTIDPFRSGSLWVTVVDPNYPTTGLHSNDDGVTWQELDREMGDLREFHFDHDRPNIIYGRGTSRLWRSDDGGASWSLLFEFNSAFYPFLTDLAIDPTDSDRIYLAGDHLLLISEDGGDQWHSHAEGIEIECRSGDWKSAFPVYCNGPRALVASPRAGGPVFAATGVTHLPGSGTGIFTSSADRSAWVTVSDPEKLSGGHELAITPDGQTLYLAAPEGGVAVLHLGNPRRSRGRHAP